MPRSRVAKPELPRVPWEPLHDKIYRELRAAIMAAKFAPGQKLTVRTIAEVMGVSPMPIRAAFLRLVADKAVELRSNGSIALPELSRPKFEELIDLRIDLEGLAAEKAATKITSKELVELERIAHALTKAAERDEADAYLEQNQKFKFAVFEAARLPVLLDLIERLWMQIGPFMRYYSKGIRRQLEIDQHEAVLAALRAGDAKAARRAMERDIADGAKFLLKVASFPTSGDPSS